MPTTAPENKTAARGRNAASKPLVASTTSSTSKSKSTTTNSRSGSISSNPSRTSSIKSSKSSKVAAGSSTKKVDASSPQEDQPSEPGFKVTKLSSATVTLQTTWSPTPVSERTQPAPTPVTEQPQAQTSDPLQIASQVYPWTYMSSTLDACFQNAESAATKSLETRATELSAEEEEVSEQLDRLHAERSIEFFDELGSDTFAKEAPAIMQLFHSHGEACNVIEVEALKLVSRDAPDPPEEDPLKVYRDMLHDLEHLHGQATTLQDSILKLTENQSGSTTETASSETEATTITQEVSSARSQVSGVFTACLPVLRARLANLSMAQELIDSALENASLSLRMESMGLMD